MMSLHLLLAVYYVHAPQWPLLYLSGSEAAYDVTSRRASRYSSSCVGR